jgi:hypothetical protein
LRLGGGSPAGSAAVVSVCRLVQARQIFAPHVFIFQAMSMVTIIIIMQSKYNADSWLHACGQAGITAHLQLSI